jgi:Flp pilus assembly protein TadB
MKSEMATAAPSPPLAQKGVRKMLLLFAALGIVGVLLLLVSVLLGLAVLVVAEAFFFLAYRRFARRARPAGG